MVDVNVDAPTPGEVEPLVRSPDPVEAFSGTEDAVGLQKWSEGAFGISGAQTRDIEQTVTIDFPVDLSEQFLLDVGAMSSGNVKMMLGASEVISGDDYQRVRTRLLRLECVLQNSGRHETCAVDHETDHRGTAAIEGEIDRSDR